MRLYVGTMDAFTNVFYLPIDEEYEGHTDI
jgi:hypothetical protein